MIGGWRDKLRSPMRPPLLLLAGAVLLVYHNSFSGVFQFDDYRVIVGQSAVHSWSAWLADLPRGIRPLLKLTYMLNWTLGPEPFGFHLLNVTLHAANSGLLFFLFLSVQRSAAPSATVRQAALAAALLFAVHPALTEAVTYISGRSTSLMTFFYLASLLFYVRGSEQPAGDRRGRLLLYLFSPLFFVLAVVGKETAVTLPLALLLLEWVRSDRPSLSTLIWRQAVHWLLLAVLLLGLGLHPRHGPLLAYSFELRSPTANLLAQVDGIYYLLSRLVALNGLNIDPDLTARIIWSWPAAGWTGGLVALLLAGFWLRRSAPLAGFGLLWFFIHLLPTNSLVPRLDLVNERQLYPAAAGIFLALATILAGLHRQLRQKAILLPGCFWPQLLQGVVPVLLLALPITAGAFTIARNRVYQSEIALWEDTVRKSPAKARVWNNLGYAYFLEGRKEEAQSAFLAALALQPNYPRARANLGLLTAVDDEKSKALPAF